MKVAKDKGVKAPVFDLCRASVPKTNLFCADAVGYERVEMPQLSAIEAAIQHAPRATWLGRCGRRLAGTRRLPLSRLTV